jgi:hypothetical protein
MAFSASGRSFGGSLLQAAARTANTVMKKRR